MLFQVKEMVLVAWPVANQCADKNHFLYELGSGERETDYSQAISFRRGVSEFMNSQVMEA